MDDNKEFIITSNKEEITQEITVCQNEKNICCFEITNTTKHKIEYNIKIKEITKAGMTIIYKLKENNTYIKLNSNSYMNYLELNAEKLKIDANTQKLYALEWKYIDNGKYNEKIESQLEITVSTKNSKKLLILWIILSIIIIASLLLLCKNYHKKPTATLGEKDVNTDLVDNNSSVVVENSPTPEITPMPENSTNKPSTIIVRNETIVIQGQPTTNPTQEPVEINKEFVVTSKSKKWTEILDIFNNEKYNGMPVIYPGIKNTYYFEFTNTQDFDVECSIKFEETNTENLPIKYKLKENGTYIRGNENTYVNYNDLNTQNIIVKSNSQNIYALEWQWIDNTPNDNAYGDLNKTITYQIEITVDAEEK